MIVPLKDRERSAILSSLKAGVVPAIGLQHIQVGRKHEVEAFLSDLDRVEQGGASVRFVVGRFGAGKSFFLNLVQTVALERKFVIARADITTERRLHGTGGQARSMYSALMASLATRSRPEGGALSSLVERWVGEVAHEVKSSEADDAAVERRIAELLKPLQDLVSGYDFANVLSSYWRGYTSANDTLRDAAVRWLRAEYTTKTEARRDLDVRTTIDDAGFYDHLKLMAAFCRIAGYRGILVAIDELVVLSHRLNNRGAREKNYEAILRILNDCLQGNVSGIGFVFAATDACMTDRARGLHSYEALATRLAPNRFATDGAVDLAGPVLTLPNLTKEEGVVLLHNLRRVHARGEDEGRFLPDAGIEAFLLNCQKRVGAAWFQTPRDTVKDFVGLLDVLEQNPAKDWRVLLEAMPAKPATQSPEDLPPPPDDATSEEASGAARKGRDDDLTRLPV